MTAAIVRGAAVAETDRTAFTFGLRADGYDRRAELTKLELDTLLELGPVGLRRSRARGAAQRDVLWDRLALLAEPLDDARAVLHHPAHARYRRASAHAAGLCCSTAPSPVAATGAGRPMTGRACAAPARKRSCPHG